MLCGLHIPAFKAVNADHIIKRSFWLLFFTNYEQRLYENVCVRVVGACDCMAVSKSERETENNGE